MMKYDNCFVNIDNDDLASVNYALSKNSISGKGPFVEKYEQALGNYFGEPNILACSNATLGIRMILHLEKIGPSDEVILPPTAPVMTILPILACGAKPVFVDSEDKNFNIDLNDLRNKITKNTRLLINVPMWGHANNIRKVVEICKGNKVKVLEDNSHCHGTRLEEKFLGGFGDYSVFSTHERKLITTGEGGFLIIKSKEDYNRLHEIRSFGEVYRDHCNLKILNGSYGYFFGLNYKLSSINAALGVSQVKKLESKIDQRTKNAQYYLQALDNYCGDTISEVINTDKSKSNYYSIVFRGTYDIKETIEEALLKNNIISDPARYKYQPLYKMPLFRNDEIVCKNSEDLINSIFTLPTHEGLTKSDLDFIIKTIQKVLK